MPQIELNRPLFETRNFLHYNKRKIQILAKHAFILTKTDVGEQWTLKDYKLTTIPANLIQYIEKKNLPDLFLLNKNMMQRVAT